MSYASVFVLSIGFRSYRKCIPFLGWVLDSDFFAYIYKERILDCG